MVLLGLSLIDPPYPRQQPLQHAPTVLAILWMLIAAWRARRGKSSGGIGWPSSLFLCGTAFLWLHVLGARYIYTFVPYDDWARELFGGSISELFGWDRNHYDRLVHFCFGALFVAPAVDVGRRYGQMTLGWSLGFALLFVAAASAVYEVFEWLLTVVMTPRDAEAYNGQQGDYWDPQRDMALAFAGSLVAGLFVIWRSRRANALDGGKASYPAPSRPPTGPADAGDVR